MEVLIRELTGIDLHKGFLETLASLADVDLQPEDAVGIFRNRLKAGVRTFVAEAQGRIVGTTTLLVEEKFIHAGGRVGHIEDVAVHREFRKQGIGNALVQYAVEESKKLGCYKVILNCFEHLVPFYSGNGFRRQDVGMRIDL